MTAPLETHHVLLVEDNAVCRRMVVAAMAAEPWTVTQARDAEEALQFAHSTRFDLVLTDVGLPGMSGVELCRALHRLPSYASVPIVALTGFLHALFDGHEFGFNGVLIKPIDPTELVATIDGFLINQRKLATKAARPLRVLLVDDSPVTRRLLELQLSAEGFDVTAVDSALAAVAAVHEQTPDVVLSDVLMPEVDGFELATMLRRRANNAEVPVVLISSHFVEPEDMALARSAGATALLARSADMSQLVNTLLDASAAQSPDVTVHIPDLHREMSRRAKRQLALQVDASRELSRRCAIQSAELAVLARLAASIAGVGEPSSVVEDMLLNALDAASVSSCLLLRCRRGAAPEVDTVVGIAAGDAGLWGALPALRGALERGEEFSIPTPELSEAVNRAVLAGIGHQSAAVLPLMARGELQGVMVLASSAFGPQKDTEQSFFRSLASHVAEVIALDHGVAEITTARRRFAQLLDSAPCAIVAARPNGRVVHANGAAARLFALSTEQLLERTLGTLLGPLGATAVEALVERGITEGHAGPTVLQANTQDGGVRALRVSATRMDSQAEAEVVLAIEDVTDERAAAARELRAQQLSVASTLAVGMSHDINNMLTVIRMSAENAIMDIGTSSVIAEDLKDIVESAERASAMSRDLLAFAGRDDAAPEQLDVGAEVRRLERRLRARLASAGRLSLTVPPGLPPVTMAKTAFERILLNLVFNACDAIEGEGEVRITVRHPAESRHVVVEVSDDGCGIEPDLIENVFEPFYTRRRTGRGSGLGLAAVRGLVNQFNGQISVVSEVGVGTTFRVQLPVAATNAG